MPGAQGGNAMGLLHVKSHEESSVDSTVSGPLATPPSLQQ
jgi:hypothetical protein